MEKRASSSSAASRVGALEKRIPKNPKYDHIESTLNTGPTIARQEVVTEKMVAKRRNELFKRIRPATLAKLLQESNISESIYNLNLDEDSQADGGESIYGYAPSVMSAATGITAVSGMTNVSVLSTGTAVVSVAPTDELGISSDHPVLLLDMREQDEFELYHIKEARLYPATMLSRDRFTPDLLRYKNKEGKLIVVYGNDERTSIPTAQLFVQKGFDNVYMLTGGVEEFCIQFHDLIEGTNPPPRRVISSRTSSSRSTSSRAGSAPSSSSSSGLTSSALSSASSVSGIPRTPSSVLSRAGSTMSMSSSASAALRRK